MIDKHLKQQTSTRGGQMIPEAPSQAGFGMSLIAITIAIIMGISAAVYFRQVSTQSLQLQDMYASGQSHWSAMSGIEYGLYKAELGEADVSGTYTFYNSTITLDTLEAYTTGGALPDYWYMVTSRGSMGNAYRDLRILSKKSLKTIWGDVSIIEGTGDVDIKNTFTLNDSLYIGQDVTVQAGTVIGDPPGTATHLYTPTGKSVSGGQEDAYFTSGEHPKGWLFNPDFNTAPYDSLLDIASAITVTNDNKINGNKKFKNVTIDLNTYTDSTLYVNGKITLLGCTITGGDVNRPAVIVAEGKIICSERSGTETTIGDNVIFIAGDDILIHDYTEFGLDHSGLTPENRPQTFNLMYAFDFISIDPNAIVWSQIFATDDVRLQGSAYGIIYAPDKFTFNKSSSYLEGAVFVHKPIAASGSNEFDIGVMNLNHFFHEDYFKTYDYGVIANSLLEY